MTYANPPRVLGRLLLLVVIALSGAPSAEAAGGPDLRFVPSLSPEVTGYTVHVGSESGFFAEQAATAQIDIGLDFTLLDGVARYPLDTLISQSAWVVMTAYGDGGLVSAASNEIFAELPVACSVNADCDDGNFCNGVESCDAGSCSLGAPPVCTAAGACTVASCDPLAGCVLDPAADGLWCDDGDPETFADVCDAGSCQGEVSSGGSSESFFTESFEASAAGSDPIGWLDTASGSYSQVADDFHVGVMTDGNHVLQTTSSAVNLHSHLMDGGSSGWHSYELSGRMQIASSTGGIGVTLYSSFPEADSYYRLRRYDGNTFHFAPHPGGHGSCVGDDDTGVRPNANRWYAFRFRAFSEDGGTRVQAKVWDTASSEPSGWQADCFDPIESAFQGGAPGVWSMGAGAKYWDDLAVGYVASAAPPPVPEPDCSNDSDCSDGNACNGAERCASGVCVAGSPLGCDGGDQCNVASCDAALGCVLTPVANGSSCDDQDLCTAQDRCQAGVCTAGGALSCPAPNQCQAGYCDPQQGCGAENLPDGRPCDDGDARTQNDACNAGSCHGDPIVEPEPDCSGDSDCSDGNACNGAERCVGGACVAGSAPSCNGGDQCNIASCDAALGCVIEPVANGAACDDQDLCTSQDSCQAGACTAGGALSCPAPNQCQAGYCDPQQGCSAESLPDGRPCDDGDPNTGNDACNAGSCSGEPVGNPEPEPESGGLFDDFEGYAAGDAPSGWLDTAAGNSLAEAPGTFRVFELEEGNRAFGTQSTAANLHSHYVADNSAQWTEYEYRGRMRIDDNSGGVGVTLYSDYPNSDSYYRLRRYQNSSFHLASHPDGVVSCVGSTDTGVRPESRSWYSFRFQASAEGAGTRVRARVWQTGGAEPLDWQVDCLTTGFGTYYAGSPGVWSMGGGAKYWDDLEIVALSDLPASEPSGGAEDFPYSEDFEGYSDREDPVRWLDTAPRNSMVESPNLFGVLEQADGNHALWTPFNTENVHSHLLVPGGDDWSDYEYSGRMQVSDQAGGVGVTLYSDYPNSDTYYRLRRIDRTVFGLSAHPEAGDFCIGRTQTGLMPIPGYWYRFRFQAMAAGAATHLRAKVWPEVGSEPGVWQIDCAVEGASALRAGRPGVWATGRGAKAWDDLAVREIPAP